MLSSYLAEETAREEINCLIAPTCGPTITSGLGTARGEIFTALTDDALPTDVHCCVTVADIRIMIHGITING